MLRLFPGLIRNQQVVGPTRSGDYMVSILCPEGAEMGAKERLGRKALSLEKERDCRFGATFPATPFLAL